MFMFQNIHSEKYNTPYTGNYKIIHIFVIFEK